MDRQKVFNKVYTHMMTMKEQSKDSLNGCAYRGDNNNMCAIGCLIADEFYDLAIEGRSIRSLEVQSALNKSGIVIDKNKDAVIFLRKLQDIHDHQFTDRADWLESFAKKHNLTIPTL